MSIFNLLKTTQFSDSDIDKILRILKDRNFIVMAVKTESQSSVAIMEYLYEFWNIEKSQYIREMELKGKSIRRPHAEKIIRIINKHWKPIIQGMKVRWHKELRLFVCKSLCCEKPVRIYV